MRNRMGTVTATGFDEKGAPVLDVVFDTGKGADDAR
jgi:hypothetical protein